MTKNYGELYNVLGWGDPYFAVNAEGHLCARPHGRETMPGQEIDIHSVILKALETPTNGGKSKAQFPMILRFPNVLKNRLDSLHAAFKGAIDSLGYTSRYQGVLPIKVNQNKAVVQDLVAFGYDESYGLEAGSKPVSAFTRSWSAGSSPVGAARHQDVGNEQSAGKTEQKQRS